MQLTLGSLHDGRDMLEWLTRRPFLGRLERALFGDGISASVSSALMIVAPVTLVHWALGSLLIGLGIYYGLIYHHALGRLQGTNANLAVLLVFVFCTLLFVGTFLVPQKWKEIVTDLLIVEHAAKVAKEGGQDYRAHVDSGLFVRHGPASLQKLASSPHSKAEASNDIPGLSYSRAEPKNILEAHAKLETSASETIASALQASITAQRASLEASEVLLHAYAGASAK